MTDTNIHPLVPRDSRPRALLVTGGAGFIGSAFVDLALRGGHRVVVLDALTYAGRRDNLPLDNAEGAFRLVVGNICDAPLVLRLLSEEYIDAVVNFAAESHVDRSINDPGDFIRTNVVGTFELLQASLEYWRSLDEDRRARFSYLQVSTDEVFGSLGPAGRFSETSPMQPNSPYAAAKAAGDHLVRAWNHTYGLPTLTTNCSNNYGPRQYPEKLIPVLITSALTGKLLPIYGNGGNTRDWIHVEDHANGILLALERGRSGETYCFGGNAERTNIDVAHRICDILDELHPRSDRTSYGRQIAFVTDRLGHDWRYAIDDTRAVNELRFTRKYTFESGLLATVCWYLEHQTWCSSALRSNP